jgi:hemolysin activation/secretion protein
VQSYQAYSFIDYGRTKLKVPGAGEAKKDSLTSAGLGVRFNLAHDFSGYVELDTPLTKKVASEGDNDSRLFFNILKRF